MSFSQNAAPAYPGDPLELDDSGAAVRAVQRQLNAELGGPDLAVDGRYGPRTDAAVRRFQAENGLAIDGDVGPNTWAALFDGGAPAARPAQAGNASGSTTAAEASAGREAVPSWKVSTDKLDAETLRVIEQEADSIREAAAILDVSPVAIAVAISEEVQDVRDRPLYLRVADEALNDKARIFAETSTHGDFVRELRVVDALIAGGVPEKSNALKAFTVMTDVGVGNIKIRTGIQLLEDYLDDPDLADDPLGLESYESAYDSFVVDLVDDKNGLQSKIAGLMIAEGEEFFESRLGERPGEFQWQSYNEEQQAELLATYYNFGRPLIEREYEKDIARNEPYDPRPDAKEGAINTVSFAAISDLF